MLGPRRGYRVRPVSGEEQPLDGLVQCGPQDAVMVQDASSRESTAAVHTARCEGFGVVAGDLQGLKLRKRMVAERGLQMQADDFFVPLERLGRHARARI